MSNIIKVKANDDFRSFKKGYTATFDYRDTDTIFLMGINGCGKSTIVQAIRGELNSNSDAESKWGAKYDCAIVKEKFDITNEGFEKIFHLDIDGLDNAYSMYNACDATSYFENGGWGMKNLSSGEKSVMYLAKLCKNIIDNESTLIIVDEMDNHLDCGMRMKFGAWLNKIFPKSKKLIITHDILMATINNGNIVEIKAKRTKKSKNLFCEVLDDSPILWADEMKKIFFYVMTGRDLSENSSNKEDIKINK